MTRGWNAWSVAALGLVFVMATALVAGLVIANWSESSQEPEPRKLTPTAASRSWQSTRTVSVTAAAAPIARVPEVVAIPTAEAVQDCNRRANDDAGDQDRTDEVASGGGAAAGGGTLYGLDKSRRNDEKYRASYASCMRARGYVAG